MKTARSGTIGASKARARFGALLRKVGKGKEIVITHRGKLVARLVPVPIAKKFDPSFFDRIRAFHGKIVLPKGETIKDLINAGRRF